MFVVSNKFQFLLRVNSLCVYITIQKNKQTQTKILLYVPFCLCVFFSSSACIL